MPSPLLLLLIFGIPLLSQAVASGLRKRFVQFSKKPMRMSGREAAEEMLRQRGIHDVQVISVSGQLTDHYDPRNKTVNLSEVVYNQRNVAAVAVATHECGHAVQDATNYSFLTARTKLVPFLGISNMVLPIIFIGGSGISQYAGQKTLAILCLVALGFPALFSLITLPVEFNASRRALDWLAEAGIAVGEEYKGARKALFWAAMTYVVVALGAIAQALYFAKLLLGRR